MWDFEAITDYDGQRLKHNYRCRTQKELTDLSKKFHAAHEARIMELTGIKNKTLLLDRMQDADGVKQHLTDNTFSRRRREYSKGRVSEETKLKIGNLTINILQLR